MPIHARLLILAKDLTPLLPLGEELDRLGLKTISTQDIEAACAAISDLCLEAALITEDAMEAWPALVSHLKHAATARHFPIMAICQNAARIDGLSLSFRSLPDAQQVLMNTEHLIRAAIAEDELASRLRLFKKSSDDFDLNDEISEKLTVLSIGQPAPDFLALSHALKPFEVELIAALTSYSAFDYLHDKTFDAVLLWADDTPSEALSIASGMRRNTRLYHTPILLRLTKSADLNVSEAFMRGINDLANATTSVSDIATQLMQLASLHRRQMQVRRMLEALRKDAEMDPGTGLFSRSLFASHMARLARTASQQERALSVCVLRITETAEVTRARQNGKLDKALTQVGSMIGRLIRTEDTAGRLSAEVFALALPATPVEVARQVSERIAAVVACTAFEGPQGTSPFVIELEAGLAQVRHEEDPAEALARAANAMSSLSYEA